MQAKVIHVELPDEAVRGRLRVELSLVPQVDRVPSLAESRAPRGFMPPDCVPATVGLPSTAAFAAPKGFLPPDCISRTFAGGVRTGETMPGALGEFAAPRGFLPQN